MRSSLTAPSRASRAASVRAVASAKPRVTVIPHKSKLLASAAATAASLCLLASPVQAASLNSLADVMRDTFAFVDADGDGVVTMQELQKISGQASYSGQGRSSAGLCNNAAP